MEQARLIGTRWSQLLLGTGLCGYLCAAIAGSVTLDLHHLPHIGNAYYPAESKRLYEEGICKVTLTVTAKKEIHDIRLTESSGYPRLDEACMKAFTHGGLLPAEVDGKPIDSTVTIPVVWAFPTTSATAPHVVDTTVTTGLDQQLMRRVPTSTFTLEDTVVCLVSFAWADVTRSGGYHLIEWHWLRDDVLVSHSQYSRVFQTSPHTAWSRRAASRLGPGHYRVENLLDGEVVSSTTFEIKAQEERAGGDDDRRGQSGGDDDRQD
jgi:TonB family protein